MDCNETPLAQMKKESFINHIKPHVTFVSIDTTLIVPVKISDILINETNYSLYAKRYYKDDLKMTWDKKVSTSLNAYIFDIQIAEIINEYFITTLGCSFKEALNKCSFYGHGTGFEQSNQNFINDHGLQSFHRLFSKEIENREIFAMSNSKDLFFWTTTCNGDIWFDKYTNSIYLGIKYKNPDIKTPQIDHYFMNIDNLNNEDKSQLKIISDAIREATGVDKMIFNQNSILKELSNLNFTK